MEQVPKHGAQPAAEGDADGAADELEPEGGAAEERPGAGAARPPGKRFIQTFVFSATLTLPSSLRDRLRKGGQPWAAALSPPHADWLRQALQASSVSGQSAKAFSC